MVGQFQHGFVSGPILEMTKEQTKILNVYFYWSCLHIYL